MAYSDITFSQLYEKFGVTQQSVVLFEKNSVKSIAPSNRLKEDIKDSENMPLYSEKAKSEVLIYPILREIKKRNPQISIFSGYTFNVNSDLAGAPDFLISANPNLVEPQSPIFCLVESKNKSPEEGFSQCAAEMYAAHLFNQRMKEEEKPIFGAVTNGFDWVFLKYENGVVYVDTQRYYLNELPKLLGIFQSIISRIIS
jgi:hypothetical protein